MEVKYTKNKGDLLVIMITGLVRNFIAEVVEENPLTLKVAEKGPFSSLKDGDFIICNNLSVRVQGDENTQQELLKECVDKGNPLASGIKQLGGDSDTIYEILPIN